MSDHIATRCLMRHGAECLLYVERPLEDEDGAWMRRADLVEGSREGWFYQVYGYDGIQSLLLTDDPGLADGLLPRAYSYHGFFG